MRKQKLIIGVILLSIVTLLAMLPRTRAQTGFPVGLEVTYYYSYPDSPSYPGHDVEYEILGWNTSIGDNILEARSRTDSSSWYTFYFNPATWLLYSSSGYPISYMFPPLWVQLGVLVPGGTTALNSTSGYPMEFQVTANVPISVPAGGYTCWLLVYSYSYGGTTLTRLLYYDMGTGAMICYDYEYNDYSGYNDQHYRYELSESNLHLFNPWGQALSLTVAVGLAAYAVITTVLIFRYVRRGAYPQTGE
ncbi:MAG: hypothetical protein ACFFCO_09600 [Promethearchaeota archaeon]